MPGLRSAPRTEPVGAGTRSRLRITPALPAGTRLVPWRAGDGRAHLVVAHAGPLPSSAVDACVERARREGYRGIVTSALAPPQQVPFRSRDFTACDHLHLLECTLRHEPPPPRVAVRRVRRRERARVLAIDDLAFPEAWRLGPSGLRDALGATPLRQFRATGARAAVTGYAITGFHGRHGYLQRLATDPAHHRHGLGRALVADSLRYAWQRGATRVFVNTQVDNAAALALYTSSGFETVPGGLAVLGLAW